LLPVAQGMFATTTLHIYDLIASVARWNSQHLIIWRICVGRQR
jgi:hypothetical protein